MLNWSALDPARTERGIQALLLQLYPGLRSLDGAGGDGGRDAQLLTTDGKTVFEIKSFGRLTSSARRQIEKSLRKAVESTPDMTRWILVIPMNMTPTRPGVRNSEEAWFDNRLPSVAPGVELTWRGQDWLDVQLASHLDIQRAIEGADSQILQRSKDFGLEQAVIAAGSRDVLTRLTGLQGVVDEVSPHWTLDLISRDGQLGTTLRAKTPEAPIVDPITITPTVTFRKDDPEAEELRQRFLRTIDYGGRVDLPAGVVTEFHVDASPEARLLIPDRDPEASEFSFISKREELDRPLRCFYEIRNQRDQVIARQTVFARECTSGARGVTLFADDAAGIIKFAIRLPLPARAPAPGSTGPLKMSGGGIEIDIPDSFVGYDVDSLQPVLEVLAHAVSGTRLRFELPNLGSIEGTALPEAMFPQTVDTLQLVQDLHRLQVASGSLLRFPDNVTVGDAKDLRRLVRTMDGETVEHDGGLEIMVRSDSVAEFLNTWETAAETGGPAGFLVTNDGLQLQVGDLTLPFGPAALWAPNPQLTNLAELRAIAAAPTPVEVTGVPAQLDPTDQPFTWLPQEQAITYLAARAFPAADNP